MPGSHLGPLFHLIVAEQFTALRDGDRYWYTRVLSDREIRKVERLTLSKIIRKNTEIGRGEIPARRLPRSTALGVLARG